MAMTQEEFAREAHLTWRQCMDISAEFSWEEQPESYHERWMKFINRVRNMTMLRFVEVMIEDYDRKHPPPPESGGENEGWP